MHVLPFCGLGCGSGFLSFSLWLDLQLHSAPMPCGFAQHYFCGMLKWEGRHLCYVLSCGLHRRQGVILGLICHAVLWVVKTGIGHAENKPLVWCVCLPWQLYTVCPQID